MPSPIYFSRFFDRLKIIPIEALIPNPSCLLKEGDERPVHERLRDIILSCQPVKPGIYEFVPLPLWVGFFWLFIILVLLSLFITPLHPLVVLLLISLYLLIGHPHLESVVREKKRKEKFEQDSKQFLINYSAWQESVNKLVDSAVLYYNLELLYVLENFGSGLADENWLNSRHVLSCHLDRYVEECVRAKVEYSAARQVYMGKIGAPKDSES